MILDDGMVKIYGVPERGGTENYSDAELIYKYESWYSEKTVGMSRYYNARQANTVIDMLIQTLRPPSNVIICAEDVAVIDGYRYRIQQVQNSADEESGEDICLITLERIGRKYEYS